MVFIPRDAYSRAYNKILATHRRSPLTSAASVVLLVAPNVDALCASHMLADLFKHDDVAYRIIPVSGVAELENIRDELSTYAQLHTVILINMASYLDLPSSDWFGDFNLNVNVHVIDSTRPQNLANLFHGGENGDRIIVWDDGEAARLKDEKTAFEALQYELNDIDSDESDSDLSASEDSQSDEASDVDEGEEGEGRRRGKRRSSDAEQGNARKRRRINRSHRITRDQRDQFSRLMQKHYSSGIWYGQSAAGTIYILATVLERVDNDFLWFAILGLTYQYITSRISRQSYEQFHSIYYDEVSRLNPASETESQAHSITSVNPDDVSVRATEELRFMLFRHWTLYDAMYHSSYVASKLGIWKERGKKKLTGLLAKMGFSIPQTQQPYSHMDMDLKKALVQKLDEVAPEYGLVELSYPSFMRCFGYHSQPLSAADAVEGISALLDVAGGVRMEVEIEGSRNGGEWFGGGRLWEPHSALKEAVRTKNSGEGPQNSDAGKEARRIELGGEAEETEVKRHEPWWVKNFWTAYDALTDVKALRESLSLSMSLHRAIIRQGSSIIDKHDIRTMRRHRVVVLSQGPDLPLFAHPGVLSRLALWLVDALRDQMSGLSLNKRSKKSLPFVIACLNEDVNKYTVVGVMAAMDFGDVRKNEFAVAFLDARDKCNASVRHASFDTTVLEIDNSDLRPFLDALSEGPQEV